MGCPHFLMKLKTNTSLIIIIAAAILLQSISAVQYYYMRSLLADELEQRAESELTTKAVVVKTTLNLAENSLHGHVWDMKNNIAYPDSMYSVAEWVLRSHPNLLGCGIAFVPDFYPQKGRLFEPYVYRTPDGKYKKLQAAGPHHDYTTMPFYKVTINRNERYWSYPYYDGTTGKRIVTYCRPIHNGQGEIDAIFGLDVSVDWLGDTLNYRHIYPSSYDLLLTESGMLIAGPHEDKVMKEDMEQILMMINDSTVERTASKSGKSNYFSAVEPDGDKCHVYYANFKGSPKWKIAVVCYDKEVFAKLNKMRKTVGLLMLAGLGILSLIVLRFARNDRRLQTANLEKERIGSELRIARNIQMQMLPEALFAKQGDRPKREDIDIHGSLVPAREVGGDIFDYLLRDEKLFFIIGDVSGKGVPAAMVMSVIHSLFRMASAHEDNPARIMQTINETACEGNQSNMFVTMFMGVLDLSTGHLCYCNAGHDIPVVIRGKGKENGDAPSAAVMMEVKANLPVGLFGDFTYEMQETTLESGSTLFLYTDGLTEAKNNQRQQFGLERMMDVLQQASDLTPEQLLVKMTDEVHAFVENAEPSDDLTMLAIRYTPVVHDQMPAKEIALQNDIRQVKELNAFVKEFLRELGVEASLCKQLQLAVEEVVVNVMEYGYPEGDTGEIIVRASSDGQELRFVIMDSGVAFDPTAAESTDTSVSAVDRPEGGLGILLAREIMDTIDYERTDGMNVLTMRKLRIEN